MSKFIKNICKTLGENNKPTYVVMAIATVKGICRPLFTMMDKKEDPETKKYTALREGLTEVIAIPAYWSCGELASKLSKAITKDKTLVKRAETNLMFIGVCTAALFVIPALCSAIIKPVMDKIGWSAPEQKVQKKPYPPQIDTCSVNTTLNFNKYPRLSTFKGRPQVGLRIGGL